jgi:hypothetical protein
MSWASDKTRELVDAAARSGEALSPAHVKLAVQEAIARCERIARSCANEHLAELERLARQGQPVDEWRAVVTAKCSESDRIAAAIRKLGEP